MAQLYALFRSLFFKGWAAALPIAAAVFSTSCDHQPASLESANFDFTAGLLAVGHLALPQTRNQEGFESGNIGAKRRLASHAWELSLRSDNDDALPLFWRDWWYTRFDDLPLDKSVRLSLKGRGHWNYYLPMYSYDNQTWYQFAPHEVIQPTPHSLRIEKKFTRPTVWLARYEPYTYTRLKTYLQRLAKRPDVTLSSIGSTPEGRPIPFLSITDKSRPLASKRQVIIHARTHPGEVGSSFLLEGLLDFLTGDSAEAKRLREDLAFAIVPMLNVDGVVAGNNRVTPRGENLEGKWYARSEFLQINEAKAPLEVRLLHAKVLQLLKSQAPVSMALNLHASNGRPQDGVFFFPHFGPLARGYNDAEAAHWGKQMRFIAEFKRIHGAQWFNKVPKESGRFLLKKNVPETWWFKNFAGQIMALSIESTYGYAGGRQRWVTPRDMYDLGTSLARTIGSYHNLEKLRPLDMPVNRELTMQP